MKRNIIALLCMTLLAGCVSKKILRQSRMETANLRADSTDLANKITSLRDDIMNLNSRIAGLSNQNNQLNNQNSQLGEKTAIQQNEINQSQAALQRQQQRLQQLQALLDLQKNQSRELKNKMSEALKGFASNDLMVTQKNGKVYVSLSENLLFPSGSAEVNPKGVDALSKLAAVLNLKPDVAVNIEGHTDSIPIKGRFKDNWDLSTARANAIVRILVDNYRVDPLRVEASGHSYFDPVDINSTPEGRAKNRRATLRTGDEPPNIVEI